MARNTPDDVAKIRSLRDSQSNLAKNLDMLQDAIHNLAREAIGDSDLSTVEDSESKMVSNGAIKDFIAIQDEMVIRIETMIAHVNRVARHIG